MDILNFGAYPECYARVIAEFDARKHLFDTCHCVLIENQMTISKKMYRVYQHMLSYFLIRYHGRGTPIVYEVDPKFKTSGLGAPRFTKKDGAKANKKWAVAKAWSLCHDRRDTYSLELLRQCGVKAREDLADTICYEEAFFLYFFSHWQEFPVSIRSRMGL